MLSSITHSLKKVIETTVFAWIVKKSLNERILSAYN